MNAPSINASETHELVSVIISTRNRGQDIIPTIESVLQNDYPNFELIIVDQSNNNLTEEAIRRFDESSRFQYIRDSSKGLSNGRNKGIEYSKGSLLAITDDDCVVPPDWIKKIVDAFRVDERIGLIYGKISPKRHDALRDFVPAFDVAVPLLLKSVKDNLAVGLGGGGCTGLKRSAWQAVNGYDPVLGSGAPLMSMEDRDIGLKLLLKGYYVFTTPEVELVHYGFYSWETFPKLVYRDWFGIGAAYAKYFRTGNLSVSNYFLRQMWFSKSFVVFFQKTLKTRKLTSFKSVWSFWAGFIAGIRTPVNHQTINFVPEEDFDYPH